MKSSRLTLLQVTDLHVLPKYEDTLLGVKTEYYFHTILAHAFEQHFHYDALLLTGDLAQSPCDESYQRILHKVQAYKLPTFCLPGNHDDFLLMQKMLNTKQVNCQKQNFLSNWQIISLNSQIIHSEMGYLEQSELDFLESCLKENSHFHTLIAVHHHCLPTKSAWLDTMQIENSQAFLNIVTRYSNVRCITTGHIHQEMDKKLGDMRIFGTPSTCFQFALNSADFNMDRTPPGYRILELYDDGRVDSTVHRLDSPLIELELHAAGY